ncbi:MAG: hypothetical protein EOP09_09615 [Proteobacteria bacterium]|nr:MAG: hypothetical protein EOP09_09615 [Pseudomonadota bacterium]
MSRAQAILRQFLDDAERLIREIDYAFSDFAASVRETGGKIANLDCESLMGLYRPVHSLKGISQMVEEGKPLAKALHEFENCLPPLIRSAEYDARFDPALLPRLTQLLEWSKRFIELLGSKDELFERMSGTIRGESGLAFTYQSLRIWVSLHEVHGVNTTPASSGLMGEDLEWGERSGALLGLGVQIDEAQCLWIWLKEMPITVSFSDEQKRSPGLVHLSELFSQGSKLAS